MSEMDNSIQTWKCWLFYIDSCTITFIDSTVNAVTAVVWYMASWFYPRGLLFKYQMSSQSR